MLSYSEANCNQDALFCPRGCLLGHWDVNLHLTTPANVIYCYEVQVKRVDTLTTSLGTTLTRLEIMCESRCCSVYKHCSRGQTTKIAHSPVWWPECFTTWRICTFATVSPCLRKTLTAHCFQRVGWRVCCMGMEMQSWAVCLRRKQERKQDPPPSMPLHRSIRQKQPRPEIQRITSEGLR